MFTSVRVKSVEYYKQQDATSRRESLQYYEDNGTAESAGQWIIAGSGRGTTPPDWSPPALPGDAFSFDAFKKLSAGRHPVSGKPLVQRNRQTQTLGYDCQLSVPKDVSALYALAPEDVRAEIETMVLRANKRASDYMAGHFVTRRGKNGADSEAPAQIFGAAFFHKTSRAGDPHLHIHNVWANVCLREDGTTGTIDNKRVLKYSGAIAALFRAELASQLKEKYGLECVRDGRNFRIAGVSPELVKTFSKRRAMIKKAALESGYDTAQHREAAKYLNFQSRADKSDLPELVDLMRRWKVEAAGLGIDWSTLLGTCAAEARAAERERQNAEETPEGTPLPYSRLSDEERDARVTAAVVKVLTEHDSVFEHRHLVRAVFEELQTVATADELEASLSRVMSSPELQQVGLLPDGDAAYSTPAIIAQERAMLSTAIAMKGGVQPIPADLIERHIFAGRPNEREPGQRHALRPEQADAVRAVLGGGDQLALLEGRAGAGKSFTLGCVSDAAREAGFTVHGMAPSWKATDVLRTDAEIATDYSRAITGWLNSVRKGDLVLDEKTLILVDEAGMVATEHMSSIIEVAKASGARVILSGDTRQLNPVAAGAPMAAIRRVLGSAVLQEIARQKVLWQREASKDFSNNKVVEALSEYDKFGHLKFAEDFDGAAEVLIADYMASVEARPDATRLILTGWNIDVREINELVRERRRADGALSGEDVTVTVMTRGARGKAVEAAFAAGDRIILGETLEVHGERYTNNSLATLTGISLSPEGEAVFRMRFDDGRELLASASDLIGYRGEDEDRVPKLAHAYAMTVHTSQGITVDETFILNTRGMSYQATYVGMTRHRHDARMYVATDRIYDELLSRGGGKLSIGGSGAMPEERNSGEKFVTLDEVKAKIFQECATPDKKENACDYSADIGQFIRNGASNSAVAETEFDNKEGVVMSEDDQSKSMVRGMKRPLTPVPPQNFRQRMNDRLENPKPVPTPVRQPARSLRISQEERDTFVRHNLARYLVDVEGLQELGTHKLNDGSMFHELRQPEGGKVSVRQGPNGAWTWVDRDGSESGLIWDYVSRRHGLSKIDAMHRLRRDLRTEPGMTPPPSSHIPAPEKKSLVQRMDEAVATVMDRARIDGAKRIWEYMKTGVNAYLLSRGITASTQERFRSEIRTEGERSIQNAGGACFAHRDPKTGEVVGYERKGVKVTEDAVRSFSMFTNKGYQRLSVMGERVDPSRIYVAESSIDGLSIYQHDGSPARAMVISVFGSPSDMGWADLREIARKHPEAPIHVAMDNDTAGRAFAARTEEVVKLARGEDAAIVDRKPDPEFKDWNDQIQGKSWNVEARQKEEARIASRTALRFQNEAAKARREEQERLRQEQAARPSGPRL